MSAPVRVRTAGHFSVRQVVIAGIEHSRVGGVGTFMNTLGQGLYGRGYDVVLLGMQPPPRSEFFDFQCDPRIKKVTVYDRIPPRWVKVRRRHRFNRRVREKYRAWEASWRGAIDRLKPLVASWGPETVVICTQLYAMEHLIPAGLKCGRIGGPFVIAQYHSSRVGAVRVGSIRRIRKYYSTADRFLALTAEDAQAFQTLDQMNNTGWIFNPLAKSITCPAERSNEVISLSRYDDNKSVDWMIRAWAAVAPEFPTWRLRLYGEGPTRDKLSDLINRLGVEDSVTLEGITREPGAALQRSKIHIMTSVYEGLPMAIAEAARAGVPTIAFDAGPGIHALIDDGHDGIIVPHRSVLGFSESLRRLMRDEGARESMGARAAERSGRFSLDTILDEWENEFDLLTGERHVRNTAGIRNG